MSRDKVWQILGICFRSQAWETISYVLSQHNVYGVGGELTLDTAKKTLEIEHHCSRTEHRIQVIFLTESFSLDIVRVTKQSRLPVCLPEPLLHNSPLPKQESQAHICTCKTDCPRVWTQIPVPWRTYPNPWRTYTQQPNPGCSAGPEGYVRLFFTLANLSSAAPLQQQL